MSQPEKSDPKAVQQNPVTAIQKVEVVYSNGNKIAFEDEAGVKLSSLKIVNNVLKEEIRAAS